MTRLVRMVVLLSLLSLLITPLTGSPASAQSAGCQTLLPYGDYDGTLSAVMDARGYGEGQLLQEITINDTGVLSLNIDCNITGGTLHLNVYRTFMLVPNTDPVVCQYTVDLIQPSGDVVAGANGQPRIDVRWGAGTVGASDCIEGGAANTAATWRFSLDGPPVDGTISGNFTIAYDNPDVYNYEQLAQTFRDQGFEVTLTENWTMTRAAQPDVLSFSAKLMQFFLAGIPVTNRYQAAIDWDNAGPGTASFILGSDAPRDMSVTGNTATIDLPLESIQGTGDFPISIEAELDGRVDRLDGQGPLTLVPVPDWASVFNLQPEVLPDSVRYSGTYAVPTKPLDAHVVLPSFIPYVGGTWGLLPTQLKLMLAANSLGTRESGGLSAQGGFGLGQSIYSLSASGNIYGTLTHDSLNFESDPLALSAPPISFQQHLGLVSLIPGATSLFSIPVVGDLLQALDAALGITAEIHGSMTGRGRLGVSGSTLALTEGSYDAGLGVKATGGIDTPIVAAVIAGGGDGSLSMQIIPTTKVISCKVLLSFSARASVFGFTAGQVSQSYPLYTCTTATGQTVLLSAPPPSVVVGTVYGSPGPALVEQALSLQQVTNGLNETVLAENASLQARPALVTGPDGKMALVWNSVSGTGAPDAVSLRLFDGSAWGSVVTLSTAGRPSFTPSAAFTASGSLLVSWAEAQIAPDPAGLTAAFARSLEIAWAEVDAASGHVLHRGLVVDDEVMDFAPRLTAAGDGTVWLAWQSSPGANIAGTTASPNQWKTSAWTGSAWGAAEMAGQNGVGSLYWEVAAVDVNRVWMVADIDADGDLSTAADREIYIYKRTATGWAAPYRLTNDTVVDSGPLLTLTPDGLPLLAWRHGDSVMGLAGDPASAQPQTWFDESAGVSPMLGAGRLLASADGMRVLLWADGTSHGQDVWLSRYNPASQSWSQPTPLFETDEMRRALSASLLPNGDIMLGLVAAPVTSQTVTFEGGGTTDVPTVGDAARLLVARIPAGYVPSSGSNVLFLPIVTH